MDNSETAQAEIDRLKAEVERLRGEKQVDAALKRTRLARHDMRPYTLDYVERLFQNFFEIHGDRRFGDDPALIAGMAVYHGTPVMIVGHQKGRDIKQRQYRNFGMPQPEGYRKAIRAMKLAEKFHRPIICFVDTPGAFPGVGAEERGQAEAIAYNLREMASLNVPVVVCVIGEGGSGGALGIAVGNRILMQENSIYTVIAPEGCSAILWKDQEHAGAAAAALKITAHDLKALGVIDEIVPEPPGGAHTDHAAAADLLDRQLRPSFESLLGKPGSEIRDQRYDKFRQLGAILDISVQPNTVKT
jgi:acetyl-CoA carboxylase carboxyl transferase subunit alpha